MSAMVRAVVCRRLGDPTEDGPDAALTVSSTHPLPAGPLPKMGVRIQVAAASLNFADGLMVQGKYQEKKKPPFVPGSELSGVVVEVGIAVRTVRPGDPVSAVLLSGGAFADQVVVDEKTVFRLPDGCDMVQAAALPVAFGTAHVALFYRAKLQPGQVVLVLGAGGGVGIAAVQLAKRRGAVVMAVARGEAKCAALRRLGAAVVIDPRASKAGLRNEVQDFLKSRYLRGVDVVLDTVGGSLFKDSLRTLGWGGQVLIVGFASGDIPTIPANIALVKNLTVHGIYWGMYLIHRPHVLLDAQKELLQWLTEGSIHVPISHTFPLEQASQAFATLLHRESVGKVVLTFTNESMQSRGTGRRAASSRL